MIFLMIISRDQKVFCPILGTENESPKKRIWTKSIWQEHLHVFHVWPDIKFRRREKYILQVKYLTYTLIFTCLRFKNKKLRNVILNLQF